MNLSEATKQLRDQVCTMLNVLCVDFTFEQQTQRWLGEKIQFLLVNNFLTKAEISKVFDWNEHYIESRIQDYLEGGTRHISNQQALLVPVMLMMAAAKYQLTVNFNFDVPAEVVPLFPPVESIEVLPKWHVPLEDLEWFQTLSARLRKPILGKSIYVLSTGPCVTLGDLLQLSKKDFLDTPNLGRGSVQELEECLQKEGYALDSVSREAYDKHLEKIATRQPRD